MKLNFDFIAKYANNEYVDDASEKEIIQYEKYFSHYNEKEIEELDNISLEDLKILSNIRSNIISWYNFKKDAKVLDLNPNMGELLKCLSRKVKDITAITSSKIKANAMVERLTDVSNIEVIIGDYNFVELNDTFDYITIIGVKNKEDLIGKIEYAKKYLAKDGKILLSFDNKFGMKYWTGIKEDDKAQYDSIINKSERLSLSAVENILKKYEYKYKIYYPLPDYKLTNVIYTDEYLPNAESMMSRNLVCYDENEFCEFSQREAYIQLLKSNPEYFKLFANSYFLEISKQKIEKGIKYVNFEIYRKEEFNIKTIMYDEYVYKYANSLEAKSHINTIKNNIEILKKNKIKTLDNYDEEKIISKFAHDSESYDKVIFNINKKEGKEATIEALKRFTHEMVDKLPTISMPKKNVFSKYNIDVDTELLKKMHFVKDGLIDLCTQNCFLIENNLYAYDQEWYEENVPIEFIYYRNIFYNNEFTKYVSKEELYEEYKIEKFITVFEKLDRAIQDNIRNKYIWKLHSSSVASIGRKGRILKEQSEKISELENSLKESIESKKIIEKDFNKKLEKVLNENDELKTEINLLRNNLSDTSLEVVKINKEKDDTIIALNAQLADSNNKINDYINKIDIIEKSLSWRITKPLRYISWVFDLKSNLGIVDRLMPPGSRMRARYEERRHSKILKALAKYFSAYTDKATAYHWALMVEKENNYKIIPQNDYDHWMLSNDPTNEELEEQKHTKFENNPKISIITPLYNTPIDFFRELLYYLHNQTYTNWELCLADGSEKPLVEIQKMIEKEPRIKYKFIGENKGISGNTNEALKLSTGDYISLLDHDDFLPKNALYEVVKCINENPNVEFIYTDEDKATAIDGVRYDAYFKPDFAPDTLRSQNYICHFSTFRKDLMGKLKGFRSAYDGAQDYDIFLRMSEIVNPENIKHITKILYHWRVHKQSTAQLNSNAKNYAFTNGMKALEDHLKRMNLKGTIKEGSVPGIYRIDYKVKGNPKVSIVIPNKDGVDILKVCVESIMSKTTYNNFEVVIVENNSVTEEIFKYYDELQAKYSNLKVVKYPKTGFNYPGIINCGVENSDGEYIVQLNNDTELLTPNWLELMLGFCQRKDVGGVGVKLYYPDSTIQHAGVIVGLGGVAGHRFKNVPKEGHGYFAKESMIENLSAVTAACIMNPKKVYEEVGYMDEKLAVAFNDVDFCLKIREKGYLIVYNPFVEFFHYESKSRGLENTEEKIKRFQSEISRFRERWNDFLEKGDPYYNKNLEDGSEQYPIKHCKVK